MLSVSNRGSVRAFRCDVAEVNDIERSLQDIEAAWGSPDIVVNNAGISTPRPRFPDCPAQAWERTLRVTLSGVLTLSGLSLRRMRGRGGAIVNIAGLAGLMPFPQDAVYSAAKHGIVGFTRSLAMLEDEGIRVTCLCPWIVATEMVLRAGGALPQDVPTTSSEIYRVLRPISPESVASEVVRLVDTDAPSGSVFIVTPGRRARPVPEPRLLRTNYIAQGYH